MVESQTANLYGRTVCSPGYHRFRTSTIARMGLKFNCSNPACQQRIEVEDAMAGYFVPCPACGNNLQAPSSANVKLICANPECEQHIIVDAGEAGRFIRCPSCNKPMKVPGDPPKAFAPANVNRAKAKTDTFSVPNPSSNH